MAVTFYAGIFRAGIFTHCCSQGRASGICPDSIAVCCWGEEGPANCGWDTSGATGPPRPRQSRPDAGRGPPPTPEPRTAAPGKGRPQARAPGEVRGLSLHVSTFIHSFFNNKKGAASIQDEQQWERRKESFHRLIAMEEIGPWILTKQKN